MILLDAMKDVVFARYEEAKKKMEKVLKDAQFLLGPTHNVVGTVLNACADLYVSATFFTGWKSMIFHVFTDPGNATHGVIVIVV